MAETFINYVLGPHGRAISEVYIKYQFLINSVVVGFAIYKLVLRNRKKGIYVKTSAESNND